MPCLEISLPKIDNQIKEKLTYELTKVFEQSTKFGADIFGIRYHEYEAGQAASGGHSGMEGPAGRTFTCCYISRASTKRPNSS